MSRYDDSNKMDVDEQTNGPRREGQTDETLIAVDTETDVAYNMVDSAWRHINDVAGIRYFRLLLFSCELI